MKDDELQDSSEACFACQNMDAYWAEKARHDPDLRERILKLERQRAAAAQGTPVVDDEPKDSGPTTTPR